MDEQHLTLYAKGMSTCDITVIFQEMYGADVSAELVSHVSAPEITAVIIRKRISRSLCFTFPCCLGSETSDKFLNSGLLRIFDFFLAIKRSI